MILFQTYLLTMNQIKSKNYNFHTFFYTRANKQTKWYPYDSYTVRLSGEKNDVLDLT